jgi:hypothetical protein
MVNPIVFNPVKLTRIHAAFATGRLLHHLPALDLVLKVGEASYRFVFNDRICVISIVRRHALLKMRAAIIGFYRHQNKPVPALC